MTKSPLRIWAFGAVWLCSFSSFKHISTPDRPLSLRKENKLPLTKGKEVCFHSYSTRDGNLLNTN